MAAAGTFLFESGGLELQDSGEPGAALAWRADVRGWCYGTGGTGSEQRFRRPDDGDEIGPAASAAAAARVADIAKSATEGERPNGGGRGGRGVGRELWGAAPARLRLAAPGICRKRKGWFTVRRFRLTYARRRRTIWLRYSGDAMTVKEEGPSTVTGFSLPTGRHPMKHCSV